MKHIGFRSAFLLLLFAGTAWAAGAPRPAPAAEALKLPEVLERIRNAVGYEQMAAHPAGFQAVGKARYAELDGRVTLLFTPAGRFARTVTGRLPLQGGFDGKTVWATDWKGIPRALDLRERDAEVASASFLSGRWLSPKESPFKIRMEPPAAGSRDVTLTLTLGDGPNTTRMVVDGATWLPRTITDTTSEDHEVTRLEDYRPTFGFKFPFKISSTAYDETQTFTIERVEKAPTFIRDPFAMPPRPAPDAKFDPAVPAKLEARRGATGHMLIHPRVNGEDVGWFILDSGAGTMVISPAVADQLKMPAFGRITALGVGGAVKARFREGNSIRVGPMTIDKPVFIELDFSRLSTIFGVPIAGICGFDVFSRAVVTYHLDEGGVEIHDPATFKLAGGAWGDLLLNNRLPVVRAGFEGNREELFTLDTGSNATVTFHAPAVRRLKLLENREVKTQRFGGVGGFQEVKVGAIDYFQLGGKRFEKPQVQFSEAMTGAFTEPYVAGNIGGEFLRGTRVVFNYPARKIAFVPESGK